MFKKVLLPIDQSRESIDLFKKAVELAASNKSRLLVLSVIQSDNPGMQADETLKSLLTRMREQAEETGLKCDVMQKEGMPAFVICDVADELNVDLIIMGTRGINLGENTESTASRVIQLAPCPVLVVP